MLCKKLLIFSIAVILAGCSATADKYPQRLRDSVLVKISVVDELPSSKSNSTIGRSYYKRVPCEVYVLDSVYPHGVMHEIMHCFSDNWHDGVKSSEFLHMLQ